MTVIDDHLARFDDAQRAALLAPWPRSGAHFPAQWR